MNISLLSQANKNKFSIFIDKIIVVSAGVLLMTLAAKVQIPFWPVPMTLHTFAVMAFALMLGPQMSLTIFTTYLAVGTVGAPVFSGSPERGIGLAYMMGPTGGYLAGYWLAAWLTGLIGHGRGLAMRLVASFAGLALVYTAGLVWLAFFVPAATLLTVGFMPFIGGDVVKCVLAALIASQWPSKAKRQQETEQ
ncbi:biotin transporter BioY [Agrobacterium vitis]|nr:biotin transporter BioY [Agrobacterium vitis]MCM2453316.1 biotin transporter BioY [Agrobacterium vitis]MCM2468698.1 biotin transporter BioY [Agrobacterium vitis]MUO71586.1 biotin transporter BioY [Agrobacterium vitis]MUO86023.1 biotin transporter BioY [Agrobacterium vitis]